MFVIQSRYISRLSEIEKKSIYNNLERPDSFYESILQNEIENLKEFNKFWINVSIPFHIIRIEDLNTDFIATVKKLFEFLFNIENIKETVIESKILTFFKFNKKLETLKENLETQYKNLFNCFSISQKNYILRSLKSELGLFGYISENEFDKTIKEKKMLEDKDISRLISYNNFNLAAQNPLNFILKSNEFQMKNAIRIFEEKCRNEDNPQANSLNHQYNLNFLRLEI